MRTIYFDKLKWETEKSYKFGDVDTTKFDIWIPKRICEIKRLSVGYEIKIPNWFAEENEIL